MSPEDPASPHRVGDKGSQRKASIGLLWLGWEQYPDLEEYSVGHLGPLFGWVLSFPLEAQSAESCVDFWRTNSSCC